MTSGPSFFSAPWSGLLKLLTLLSIAVLVGVAVLFAVAFPRYLLAGVPFTFVMAVVFTVLPGSALFAIRGYEIEASELLIHRLLWATRMPLDDLRVAWADPTAMKGSLRLFGNGGLFSFSGLFWNRRLGRYRAFATDPRNAVVLEFPDRILVVTPESPSEFLETLKLYRPYARVSVAPVQR